MEIVMKTKTKKKKAQEYKEPPSPPKPTIPNDILKAFLDRHIKTEDAGKVSQVSDGFLWKKGNLERYRINVWIKQFVEGQYCANYSIDYSWFVHFDRDSQTLTDKTIAPKPQKEKVF
tara:strand:+ start:65 stop:415 length:351 start_codon:yes stop_codon:yes gene_type:complete